MGYRVRRASKGHDRRHGRSLAEILSYGKGIDEPYDEAVGPSDKTRRPREDEWEAYDMYDRLNNQRGLD